MTQNQSLVEVARTFYAKLAKNNNREWFQANKAEYEKTVRDPAKFFAELVNAELEELTGRPHKTKIFRINRDVRFSKDKTPYNTHLHILWSPDVQKEQTPGWFLGISPAYVKSGAGMFGFSPDLLTRYRRKVADDDAGGLVDIINDLEGASFIRDEPELKRVPKPYEQDHPNGLLLRRKGFAMWQDFDDEALKPDADLLKLTMQQFRQLRPLHEWLLRLC